MIIVLLAIIKYKISNNNEKLCNEFFIIIELSYRSFYVIFLLLKKNIL